MELKDGDVEKLNQILEYLSKGGIIPPYGNLPECFNFDAQDYARLKVIFLDHRAAETFGNGSIKLNANTRNYLNANYFNEVYDKQNRDRETEDLKIKNLSLQNENLKYVEQIRRQEEAIRKWQIASAITGFLAVVVPIVLWLLS